MDMVDATEHAVMRPQQMNRASPLYRLLALGYLQYLYCTVYYSIYILYIALKILVLSVLYYTFTYLHNNGMIHYQYTGVNILASTAGHLISC